MYRQILFASAAILTATGAFPLQRASALPLEGNEIVAPSLDASSILIDQVGEANRISRDGLVASGSNGARFAAGNASSLDVQQVGSGNRLGLDVQTSGGGFVTVRQGSGSRTTRNGTIAPSVTLGTVAHNSSLTANIGHAAATAPLNVELSQTGLDHVAVLNLGNAPGGNFGASPFSFSQTGIGQSATVNAGGVSGGAWSIAQEQAGNSLHLNSTHYAGSLALSFTGNRANAATHLADALAGSPAGITLPMFGMGHFGIASLEDDQLIQVDMASTTLPSELNVTMESPGQRLEVAARTGAHMMVPQLNAFGDVQIVSDRSVLVMEAGSSTGNVTIEQTGGGMHSFQQYGNNQGQGMAIQQTGPTGHTLILENGFSFNDFHDVAQTGNLHNTTTLVAGGDVSSTRWTIRQDGGATLAATNTMPGANVYVTQTGGAHIAGFTNNGAATVDIVQSGVTPNNVTQATFDGAGSGTVVIRQDSGQPQP